MSDDKYSGDLHAWIEPEIEARVVALILNEASEFEAEELERMMEERPEIRTFKRRLESVHGLLGANLDSQDEDDWQLAPAKRTELLEALGLAKPVEGVPMVVGSTTGKGKEPRIRRAGRRVIWSAVACFAMTLFTLAFLFRPGEKSLSMSPEATDKSERDPEDRFAEHYARGDDFGRNGTRSVVSDELLARLAVPAAKEDAEGDSARLALAKIRQDLAEPAGSEEMADNLLAEQAGEFESKGESSPQDPLARHGRSKLYRRDFKGKKLTAAADANSGLESEAPSLRKLAAPKVSPEASPPPPAAPVPELDLKEIHDWGTGWSGSDVADSDLVPAQPAVKAKSARRARGLSIGESGLGGGGGEVASAERKNAIPELGKLPASGANFKAPVAKGGELPDPTATPADRGTVAPGRALNQPGAGFEVPAEKPRALAGKKKELSLESFADTVDQSDDDKDFVSGLQPQAARGRRVQTRAPETGFPTIVPARAESQNSREALQSGIELKSGSISGRSANGREKDHLGDRDVEGNGKTNRLDSLSEFQRKTSNGIVPSGRGTRKLDDAMKTGKAVRGETARPGEDQGQGQSEGQGKGHGLAEGNVLKFNPYAFSKDQRRSEEETAEGGGSVRHYFGGVDSQEGEKLGGSYHRGKNSAAPVVLADSEQSAGDLLNKGLPHLERLLSRPGDKNLEDLRKPLPVSSGGFLLERDDRKLLAGPSGGFAEDLSRRSGRGGANKLGMAGQKVAESLFQDLERNQALSSMDPSGFLSGSGGGGVSGLHKFDVPEPATESEVMEEWKSRVSALAEIEGKDGFGKRLDIREGVEEEFAVDHIKEAREFEEDARGIESDPYTPLGSLTVDPIAINPPGISKERRERKALSGERNSRAEEVRHSVNAEEPATIREIGVTVAVTPTVLPDGAIRMKIRPRSAQGVEEIIGQSGHKYPRVSESMLERITQIPEGHSLVVGGFYGQVKQKGDKKVPTLGDLPAINLFLMDQAQKADKETASVAFVLTPATHKSESTGKDEVVIETRVFSMNNSSAGRRVVDWSSSLDAGGVSLETIGSLNSLFGLENSSAEAGKVSDRKSREIATSDGSIVLSPTQLDGVLRELKRGGLVTQTSNPTLITEDNEQATISLIGRVPILTTTIDETEVSNQGTEEVRYRMDEMEERQWDIPLAAWRKIESHEAHLEEVKLNARSLLADDQSRDLAMTPQEALKNYGISFPPGTGARYVTSTGSFVVRNTAKNLGVVDRLVQGSLRQLSREQEVLKEYEQNAGDHPFSTFSLNVSDVSFKLAKAALFAGQWPNAEQVRVEEFVNAFDYGDPAPSQAEKVACTMEQAAHPFLQQRNLLRVSMRTAALGRAASTPLRLTVLLDHSGSMDRADRVESVKNAFRLLAAQLNPQDQVTLIGFARTPRLLADRVSGDKVAQLAEVVGRTPSEGGTNIEEALELGIAKAKGQLLEGGQNRIILLTDGAANLGNAKPKDLAKIVERMRQQGIAFDACGVGAAGLNDDILESLTRKGDGRYYFLDRPEDADAGFAKRIAGALRPAARNVKVQMNFNPQRVGRYRLYGFEKHRLKKEDFRNDSVDAAEFAAEEAGNAIYQVELLPEGGGDIGTVSVRFQDMESGQMVEKKWTIPYEVQASRLEDSSAALRLAGGAALLGEKLKGSPIGEAVEMPRLGKLINGLTADFSSDQQVKDLVQMANKVRELANE